MLLNIFDFSTESNDMEMTDERDYMNYLPLDRLKPFERSNFYYVEKIDHRVNSGRREFAEFGRKDAADLMDRTIEYFTSNNSSEVCNTRFMCLKQHEKLKERFVGYHLSSTFRFDFNRHDNKTFNFPFTK